jgi:hypothetical protein
MIYSREKFTDCCEADYILNDEGEPICDHCEEKCALKPIPYKPTKAELAEARSRRKAEEMGVD